MTNQTLQEEVLHRIERMCVGGTTMELPRDSGSPPTITTEKLFGRIDIFTDL